MKRSDNAELFVRSAGPYSLLTVENNSKTFNMADKGGGVEDSESDK